MNLAAGASLCGRSKTLQEKSILQGPHSFQSADEVMDQAAVRLAFSTSMWPTIASSTATLACSIDAMA